MRTEAVELRMPENANIIVGQSHFIKTVEDIYEAMVNAVPGIRFGWRSARPRGTGSSGWKATMTS
jgi:adenosine/AMP kinase